MQSDFKIQVPQSGEVSEKPVRQRILIYNVNIRCILEGILDYGQQRRIAGSEHRMGYSMALAIGCIKLVKFFYKSRVTCNQFPGWIWSLDTSMIDALGFARCQEAQPLARFIK